MAAINRLNANPGEFADARRFVTQMCQYLGYA